MAGQIQEPEAYFLERQAMVETQLRRRGILDGRVLSAMMRVPRHEFVPESYRGQAYEDHPIPIGEGQTISQPFIVAISLQALGLGGSESVLEVGTGSGYQTGLLALLAKSVFSIERHPSLAHSAETTLARLGVYNVSVAIGDGSRGWREHAPFDAMLISAAAPSVPQSLVEQLSDTGKMVIPVGPPHAQELQLLQKRNGQYGIERIEGCRFVPLVGAEGY
jgi:protein-L-isoaspartate(D-aspartate) O-methyltransferase